MAKVRTPTAIRISRALYASHGVIFIIAWGFSLCALFTAKAENDALGKFDLHITKQNVNFCYVTTGCLLIAAGFGLAAQFKRKQACYWIMYCGILGIMSLAEVTSGGSALGKSSKSSMGNVRKQLHIRVLETYWKDPRYHKPDHVDRRTPMQKNWDSTQQQYKCCGLKNYQDWQFVQFGRTTLTVPRSCCNERTRPDEYCGINMLPAHPNASQFINPEGCFDKIVAEVRLQLSVMGYYCVIVSVFQISLVGVVCYLLVSKKM